ncbi:hypothetical protein INT44_002282 [Umbelopsis vinacea]|uniref:Uncharacterized protein n=1 Tax=Umbelopsis vinacea TaxID=44442 RepID=A0A8H7Q6A7_9FUNG|nr:hypothetical protein INT44_002282 [Umbelopsis vinacea]
MSVVLRSASGPLNDITLKKQLSVDRSSCIKSKPSNSSLLAAARSKTSSLPQALSTQETSPLAESKPCSKRKPLMDITLKPAEPDVDFTIYVDVPATPTQQQSKPKTDKPTQAQIVQVVTPKSDKAVDEDTLGKENIAPTIISIAQKKIDNLPMTVDKSLKTAKKQPAKKLLSSLSNKSSSDAPKRKRKPTLTLEVSSSTKRASLRMMR